MNNVRKHFHENAERTPNSANSPSPEFIQYCEALSSYIPGSFYVWDIAQERFRYIKTDDVFLCGYPVEVAMEAGHGFFSEIIHPTDLMLWRSFLADLPWKLHDTHGSAGGRLEFFCLLRLLREYPFLKEPAEVYTYHRLIPVRKDGVAVYLIGIVSHTSCKKIGCYLKGGDQAACQTYNPKRREWQPLPVPQLSKREREILTIAKSEHDIFAIARSLCISHYTARGHVALIKQKLAIQDLREAVDWLSYLHVIRPPGEECADGAGRSAANPDLAKELDNIQALLDGEQSVRSIALATGRAESTIRSWIQRGLLRK